MYRFPVAFFKLNGLPFNIRNSELAILKTTSILCQL